MWYFVFRVSPKPDTQLAKQAGGAFCNCWIDFREKEGAEHLAKFYLAQQGWDYDETQGAAWVERKDYEDGSEALLHFVEAQTDGACFVVNQWGVNGEDEE